MQRSFIVKSEARIGPRANVGHNGGMAIADPTSTRSLLAYASPSIAISIMMMPLMVYIPPFYGQEVGLDLATVGLVFLLARAWDAVIDPVIGFCSDRTTSRFGRRKPWIAIGTPALMLLVYAFYQPPAGASAIYLAVVVFAFYIGLTLFQIPYLSWGAELTREYRGRTRVTAFREGAIMVGTIVATVAPVVYFGDSNPSLRETLRLFALLIIVMLPVAVAFTLTLTPAPMPTKTDAQLGLAAALATISRNRLFLRLLAGIFLLWLGGSFYNSLVLFVVQQMLDLPMSAFFQLVLVQYGLGIAFIPFWVWLANRIGRHRALLAGSATFFVALPALLLVEPGNMTQAAAVYALKGVGTCVIWVLPPALAADTIEYGMLKGAGDDAAMTMSLFMFAQKLAFALGIGIALPLAGALGFDPRIAATPEGLSGLRWAALYAPGLLGIAAAFVLFNYPLTAKRHASIKRRLERLGRITRT